MVICQICEFNWQFKRGGESVASVQQSVNRLGSNMLVNTEKYSIQSE